MKRFLIIMLTCFSAALNILAQDDPEYRMEIGVGAGLSGYLGDFNGNLTKNFQPMATILGRYVLNPYTAIRRNLTIQYMMYASATNITSGPMVQGEIIEEQKGSHLLSSVA